MVAVTCGNKNKLLSDHTELLRTTLASDGLNPSAIWPADQGNKRRAEAIRSRARKTFGLWIQQTPARKAQLFTDFIRDSAQDEKQRGDNDVWREFEDS